MTDSGLSEMLPIDPDDPQDVLASVLVDADEKLMVDLAEHRRRTTSPVAVARRMGITVDAVRQIELGGRDIRPETLRRYMMAIGAVVRHEVRPATGTYREWVLDLPSAQASEYLEGKYTPPGDTVTVTSSSASHPYELFPEKATSREVPVELVAIRERLVRDLMAAPLDGQIVHSVDSSDGEHYTSYVARSKEGTAQMAADIVMATIGERIAKVIDICETEQGARHDPYAPVSALQITHALDPDTYDAPEES